MEQRNKGTTKQRNNGTKEQRNKGKKEQRNKGTKKQKVHPIGSGITRSPGLVFNHHQFENVERVCYRKFGNDQEC